MKKLRFHTIFEKPERLFLIVGSVFGILSVFLVPILTAPDEGTHFWISYGMFSESERTPKDLLISSEESVKLVDSGNYINQIFKDEANLKGDGIQFNVAKELTLNNEKQPYSTSSFDISHLPQALGILIGRVLHPSVGVMATIGRLANLAFYLVAIYFIIKRVRYGKLVFTFIALFPMLVHQAASLSYDVVNIVVIFAWLALMINLFTQRAALSRKQLVLLVLLALALILTKRSNILLLVFIPFLPLVLYKKTKALAAISKAMPKLNKKIVRMVLVGVVLAGTIACLGLFYKYMLGHGISGSRFVEVMFNTFFRPEVNSQLDPILTSGLVGNFGWLWYRLPEWLVIIHLIVLTLVLLSQKIPGVSKKFAIVSGMIFVLSVAAITLGMYFEWTLRSYVGGINATFAQGMQGRYFTPLLVLLIPPFAYLQKYLSVKANPKTLTILAASMAIFSLVIYVILTYIFFYTEATGVKDILY